MDYLVQQHRHNQLKYNDDLDFLVYNDKYVFHYHYFVHEHQLVDNLDRLLEHVMVLHQHHVYQL